MVGVVIVAHSKKLAEGVADATRMMADDCKIAVAGGNAEDGFGTDYAKIKSAIEEVYSPEGVVILVDMGSAVMTAEMAMEELGYSNVVLLDCPLAEGAIVATLAASCGDDLESVKAQALATREQKKC